MHEPVIYVDSPGEYADLRLWINRIAMLGGKLGRKAQVKPLGKIIRAYRDEVFVGQFVQFRIGTYKHSGKPMYSHEGVGFVKEDTP